MLAAKDARIDALLVQVGELTAQVQALVLRLGKDSANSSKPPSADGPGRRPQGGQAARGSGDGAAAGGRPGRADTDPGPGGLPVRDLAGRTARGRGEAPSGPRPARDPRPGGDRVPRRHQVMPLGDPGQSCSPKFPTWWRWSA